ncbi:MAG: hypothetical protein R2828_03675 [Saprospiraceae bacterium]
MKQLLILAAFCLLAFTGFSQHETLFSNARVVGGFGGPLTEFGLDKNIGTSVGGGGGVVIDNFFFGGYGLGSVDFEQLFDNGDVSVLDIGHGGFWLGGTFAPHKLIHLYTSARIGWGAVNVELNDPNLRYTDLDKIFVVTPEIGLELNITRWFRVAGTAGYRWVDGTNETRGYTNEDFSGGIATVTFRFGWFGGKRW